jgi:Xaa-Pro dipeptidase
VFEVYELDMKERDRRWKKVRDTMRKQGLDALVIWGFPGGNAAQCANFRYLANILSDGYLVFPLESEPTIVRFFGKPGELFWVTDIRGGYPGFSKAISERLRESHLGESRIGVVSISGVDGEMGFPYTTLMYLKENLPSAHFEDATDTIEEARRIKSDTEIRCLEIGSEAANNVIKAIANVAKPGVKDYEVKAKILDTLVRNGCEPDSLLLYCSGKEITHAGMGRFLQPRDLRSLEHGDLILTEFDAKYNGYVAQHNQPFSVGLPHKEYNKIFDLALESFTNGLKALKPGITLGDLDKAFLSPIRESGYTSRNPSFHGLGLTSEDPMGSTAAHPYCDPNNSFVIQAGMVLEFEPHVVTLDGKKGMSLGCPIVVTETGCRSLSKSWKPEFKIA